MKIGVLLLLCALPFLGRSQDTTSTKDSVVHPFKKAMMYSAIVPGMGQIYNTLNTVNGRKKAYWKVPLIYTALGAGGYLLISNQLTQKSLKTEYTNRLAGNDLNPRWSDYDNFGVLQLYRQYLDWRDLSILGLFAIYGFQILDAGVEAHFLQFDVSDNLSMQLSPSFHSRNMLGAKVTFRF
jgi:hypothetical protein